MVDTHGGGLHFVPDRSHLAQSPENVRFWKSLEDPERLLVVHTAQTGRATPFTATPRTLKDVTTRVSEYFGAATLGVDVKLELPDQGEVERAGLYTPLVSGGSSAKTAPSDAVLHDLARAMLKRDKSNSDIPAAYTYFGQFLAHDMSYLQQRCENEHLEWVNAHALHALEFASLFGTTGDGDPSSRWIEVAGATLGLATDAAAGQRQGYDLPRSISGGFPCCTDRRADSNLALAQMHVLLVRFHQMMAQKLQLNTVDAQRETKWHLQAVALTDYLPRIIPEHIYTDVMHNYRKIVAPNGAKDFLISLEFATAVFRFGHSMIRWLYDRWHIKWPEHATTRPNQAFFSELLDYTYFKKNKSGRLANNWNQMWRHMVDAKTPYLSAQAVWANPIAARLNPSLGAVPRRNFPDVPNSDGTHRFNLGLSTMRRNLDFKIPTGQEMVEHFDVPNLVHMSNFFKNHILFDGFETEKILCEQTPLWFYTLAEAETFGHGKLGPLGARIVMETFHAALESDASSILSVSADGVSTVNFVRRLRFEHGDMKDFSLHDVIAIAYDGLD